MHIHFCDTSSVHLFTWTLKSQKKQTKEGAEIDRERRDMSKRCGKDVTWKRKKAGSVSVL